MKKSILYAAAVLALMIAGSLGAKAMPYWAPRVNWRERHQEDRIYGGIRSGSLTRHEARRLEREEGRIRAHESFARADGRVTMRERRHLHRALNRESRHIYRLKHNRRHRML